MMMVHDDHFDDEDDVKPGAEGDPVEWIVDVGEDMKQVRWVKLPCGLDDIARENINNYKFILMA